MRYTSLFPIFFVVDEEPSLLSMLESPLLFGGGYVLVVTCPIVVVDDDSLAKFRIGGVVTLVFTVWLDGDTPADKISFTPASAT